MVVRLQPLIDFYDNRRPLTTLFLKIVMVIRLQPFKDSHNYCRPLTTLSLKISMVVRLRLQLIYNNRRPLTTFNLTHHGRPLTTLDTKRNEKLTTCALTTA